MIPRTISAKLKEFAQVYPVLTITGPRQSGKTTLVRDLFIDLPYISLENLDDRAFADSDPRGFLNRFPNGAVLDEIQRAPALLSYIQGIVDEKGWSGTFVLTGSQSLALMNSIAQTLAGRTALAELLPLSIEEAYRNDEALDMSQTLIKGFYPGVIAKNLNPSDAYSFYISTYVERDIRALQNVHDYSSFEIFLKLCAGRTGQLLNLSSLAADAGISHNTAKNWLTLLEATYIVRLLRPYFANIGKRLVKSPKLYFIDTGIACSLLSITDATQLQSHPLRGQLFETMIISDIIKRRNNLGKRGQLSFFRDAKGHEVDLFIEEGGAIDQIEIKSGCTVANDFFDGLKIVKRMIPAVRDSILYYGGGDDLVWSGISVRSWKTLTYAG